MSVMLLPLFSYYIQNNITGFSFLSSIITGNLLIIAWLSDDVPRVHKVSFVLFFTVLFFLIFKHVSIIRIYPIIFFLYSILLWEVCRRFRAYELNIPIKFSLIVYLIITGLLFYFHEESRFKGFSVSSTSFSLYLTVIILLSGYYFKRKFFYVIIFITSFYFIFESGTRTTLVALVFIPLIASIYRMIAWREFYLITIIIIIISAYPLYGIISDASAIELNARMDEDGGSYATRLSLTLLMVDLISENSFYEFMFGNGVEYSRIYILNNRGMDLMPHNDFLRILIDYGVIFFILFISILIKFMKKNSKTLTIGIIYLLSFYHNMIFDPFFISLMIMTYYEGG